VLEVPAPARLRTAAVTRAQRRGDLHVVPQRPLAFPWSVFLEGALREEELAEAVHHCHEPLRAGGAGDQVVELVVDAHARLEVLGRRLACALHQLVQAVQLRVGDALGREAGSRAFQRLANAIDVPEFAGGVDHLDPPAGERSDEPIAREAGDRLPHRRTAGTECRRQLEFHQPGARQYLAFDDGAPQPAIHLVGDTVRRVFPSGETELAPADVGRGSCPLPGTGRARRGFARFRGGDAGRTRRCAQGCNSSSRSARSFDPARSNVL
jgi:hypothetical protein